MYIRLNEKYWLTLMRIPTSDRPNLLSDTPNAEYRNLCTKRKSKKKKKKKAGKKQQVKLSHNFKMYTSGKEETLTFKSF